MEGSMSAGSIQRAYMIVLIPMVVISPGGTVLWDIQVSIRRAHTL